MPSYKPLNPYVPYSKSFGLFFKQRRLKAGLSQAQVADALDYTTSQVVSNWERGTQSPPFNKLLELCSILKISRKEMVERLLVEQKKIYQESIDSIGKRKRA
ncbi:MAG TPA: helix-turn-helix transcriptional regulator [Bdellovibrionota bacterium]|jgi:transcriptional regulator with XRE-family HTH domain|nr:helix-turn-helix transcriptional regulator [Bdellovibrionota bacterium]